MRSAIALLLLGCTKPVVPAPPPAADPPLFAVRADAFGPLDAKSPVTLVSLRRAFAGYEVVPINNEGLEYRVSSGGAKLFDIVTDGNGAILNIHVVTPKLTIGGWRVGERFRPVQNVTCECWADQTVCFQPGEHFAVGLAKTCRDEDLGARGSAIRITIWSPRPLVEGGSEAP